MKKNPLSFLFVLITHLFSTSLFSQQTGTDSSEVYDLNDFKFRYQRYKALEFDYRMNGNFNANRFNDSFTQNDRLRNSDFNLNANLTGSSFENSESLQRIQSFQVLLTTMSQQQKIPNASANFNRTNASVQLPYLGYENTSRKYNGNKFLLLDYGGNFSFNTYKRPETNNNIIAQSEGNETNLNLGIGVGFGRGRIENVSDAVTSYFILRDLQSNGVLQNFTATQLENLADGIVKTRNDRYIGDDRFRFVDQITRLDSICKANGIIAENPVELFAVLYDNFIFTSYFRETGKRQTFSLDANNTYSRFTENDSSPFQVGSITLGPKYEYVNATQKSMFLQRKTTLVASTGFLAFYSIDRDTDPLPTNYLQVSLVASHGYVYQPNTRTVIDVTTFASTNYAGSSGQRNSNTALGLNLNANYFFSRRFSIFFDADVRQSWNTINFRRNDVIVFGESKRNFQFTFNSGLTYAFY